MRESQYYGWVAWFTAALFFFVMYIVRVAPSVLIVPIMHDWKITATSIGTLSGFFYYAYIVLQIPVGLILDRGYPVRTLLLSLLCCIIGNVIFSLADVVIWGRIARFLIGVGAAFAFAGSIKVAVLWFKGKYLGLISGLTQTIGMLGAAVGEWSVAELSQTYHWREIMWQISGAMFVVWLMMLVFTRTPSSGSLQIDKQHSLLKSLRLVLANPQTWINGCYAGLIFLPTLVFGESWGPLYFEKVHGLSHANSAMVCSMIFVGWVIGGVFIGGISDRLGRRKPILIASAVLSLITILIVLYVKHMPMPALITVVILYGIFNTGLVASYAVGGEINPQSVTALSMATVNMLSIVLGALTLPLVGIVLDLNWHGTIQDGVRVYQASTYEMAMLLLPCALVLALITSLFVKETFCKPLDESSHVA